jgi:hypothetical protein
MSNFISLFRRKSQIQVCSACGDLEPIDDGNIDSSFITVCAAAKKGCESCSLLRHAIHDCLPEAVVSDAKNPVFVVVRRSILRDFVEIAVRFAQPVKIIVLDLFILTSKYFCFENLCFTC